MLRRAVVWRRGRSDTIESKLARPEKLEAQLAPKWRIVVQ